MTAPPRLSQGTVDKSLSATVVAVNCDCGLRANAHEFRCPVMVDALAGKTSVNVAEVAYTMEPKQNHACPHLTCVKRQITHK